MLAARAAFGPTAGAVRAHGRNCSIMAPSITCAPARHFGSTSPVLGRDHRSEVVLASRPGPGQPVDASNFRIQRQEQIWRNGRYLEKGDLLVKTISLSVDPFLRCRFNEDTGVEYTSPYEIGQPITSAGIGQVIKCGPGVKGFLPGDIVLDPFDSWPWQHVAKLGAPQVGNLQKLPASLAAIVPLNHTLGAVGQTGLTALFGMTREVSPGPGDVVVISGAAGAVGSIAGQLAKSRGATVIGIAGSASKVWTLKHELGFDGAVNYKSPTFHRDLAAATGGSSVSIYFDNVGGPTSDAVIGLMKEHSRIVLCGQIDMYNTTEEYPPPLPASSQAVVDARNISRDRYLVLNYESEFKAGFGKLLIESASERLICKETVSEGLESAPDAFLSMMSGGNVGKQVVQVSPFPFSVSCMDNFRRLLPKQAREHLASRAAKDLISEKK